MNETTNIKKILIIIGAIVSALLTAAGIYFLISNHIKKRDDCETVEIEFDGDEEPKITYPDTEDSEN